MHSLDIGAEVIDADYRGEVTVLLVNNGTETYRVETGARIAQIVMERISNCKVMKVHRLPSSLRGESGYGSTGLPAMTTADAEPTIFMPATWEGVNRVLIECCTVSDSDICKCSVD